MNLSSLFRLLSLAAIWGASFLFMKMAVSSLGPALLIEARVGFAAIFLFFSAIYLKKALQVRQHWQHFLIVGLFNTALPFLLFAYAAQTLTASLMAILNATAPIWGAAIGAAIGQDKLTVKATVGLILGVSGVAVLVGFDAVSQLDGAILAILAALAAAICYGGTSVYARSAANIDPFANAHGSMWAAALLVTPFIALSPPIGEFSLLILFSVVMLGVICTGVAYLLYFRLIADLGAPSALSVTFLIPAFGMLWGYLFLQEVVGWHTVMGSLLVVTGTAQVTGFSFKTLRSKGSD